MAPAEEESILVAETDSNHLTIPLLKIDPPICLRHSQLVRALEATSAEVPTKFKRKY